MHNNSASYSYKIWRQHGDYKLIAIFQIQIPKYGKTGGDQRASKLIVAYILKKN